MSRLADDIEEALLGTATELLDQASEVLEDKDTAPEDLRRLARELTEAVRGTLRVATSRGFRLAADEPHEL
ncbi:hypothetical protein AB0L74_02895 [Streptomyces sp. NPDC052020]|uniref:hypothetical protein n=1 Tax=Streptomyces sp. NPDC052020 TaxID=3155677 RepID=UPI00344A7EA8